MQEAQRDGERDPKIDEDGVESQEPTQLQGLDRCVTVVLTEDKHSFPRNPHSKIPLLCYTQEQCTCVLAKWHEYMFGERLSLQVVEPPSRRCPTRGRLCTGRHVPTVQSHTARSHMGSDYIG